MISKGKFVEIDYTGKIKDDNTIFDTTIEKVAKENDLEGKDFGPIVICVGEQHVLSGIDNKLEGKEIGKEYDFHLMPSEAFGSKNPKLIQLIPTSKFKQQNLQPMPGMQLNIDGMIGIIKTVSGGRTLVDFNHPLSGKELLYKVKINKEITDDREKIIGYIKMTLGIKDSNVEINEGTARISLNIDVSKEVKGEVGKKILALVPSVKSAEFAIEKKQKNK